MVMIIENATSERGGRHCALLPPPHLPSTDLICTKDVSGRKMISITNTQLQTHCSPGKCQSKWESMLTFITIWGGHGRYFSAV